MTHPGITVYGCEHDEAALFQEMEQRFGVTLTLTEAGVSDATIELAAGNHCISVSHKAPITNAMLYALSQAGVTYVSTRSAGYDHIDVDFARSVGITVGNVRYSPDSVADYTVLLILMLLRGTPSTLRRADAHDFRLNAVRGRELRDMTVGVIGTGRIGAAVISRLRGFGCRIVAYDHRPKITADYVSLDVLLQQSDIVTLHTPLALETRHLLNHDRIGQMKAGALVINTGRGALIDTGALVVALDGGKLGGAALDVLEDEEGIFYADYRKRQVANELLLRLQHMPNVVITPHTAYYTDHALHDTVEQTIINCLRFKKEHSRWLHQKEKTA